MPNTAGDNGSDEEWAERIRQNAVHDTGIMSGGGAAITEFGEAERNIVARESSSNAATHPAGT